MNDSSTKRAAAEVEQAAWTKAFTGQANMAYPAEYAIRIFMGSYPRLNLKDDGFAGKRILDMGCGDGRNMAMLSRCGFTVFGTEISDEIVAKAIANVRQVGVDAIIRTGLNHAIPYDNSYFDYLLSWNACYYMGDEHDFAPVVSEFARVLKPGGTLVLSIPKSSCFIYKDSDEDRPGYRIIRNDPFGVRNGAILRMFSGEDEIERVFAPQFENFVFASIEADCFGLSYDWHLAVCQRKSDGIV